MKIKDLNFEEASPTPVCATEDRDVMLVAKCERGRVTVVDRMTGFGWRDIETGFTDPAGKFWLASGQFDIRGYPELPVDDAIELIKQRSNTCRGV